MPETKTVKCIHSGGVRDHCFLLAFQKPHQLHHGKERYCMGLSTNIKLNTRTAKVCAVSKRHMETRANKLSFGNSQRSVVIYVRDENNQVGSHGLNA